MADGGLTAKDLTFWFLKQLFRDKASPDDFISIRVIHNKAPYFDPQTGRKMEETECLYQKNIPVKAFRELYFQGGLYEMLRDFNQNLAKPSNIYFGINARNSVSCLSSCAASARCSAMTFVCSPGSSSSLNSSGWAFSWSLAGHR